ncbi:hypothetical protein ILYODFUR_011506 [Ilyodon furcidens]|uniref:Uncharacterized protein n=1 Tax=Ilyodon furcidens TaxID=33524 RepID=A0ABV0V2C8_9TELE
MESMLCTTILCCLQLHIFQCISLKSTLTSFHIPAEDKHPYSMMLLPPFFKVGMVMWNERFPPHIAWYMLTNKFNFDLILHLPSFTCLLNPLHDFKQTANGGSYGFPLAMALFLYTSIFMECISNGCPVNRLSHLKCESLQLLQSYHGPLGWLSEQCFFSAV